MREKANQNTGKKCSCGGYIYKDWTNNGQVERCRNPQCTVDIVMEVVE
jgi:hypothetical protein